MKIKSPLSLILLLILLASCNTGNKVASSFGKRKYTKGFYLETHKKPEPPVISANATSTINNKVCVQEKIKSNTSVQAPDNDLPVSDVSSLAAGQKKILPKNIIGKVQHEVIKDNTKDISRYPVNNGVSGHEGNTDAENHKYDMDATAGLLFAIMGIVLSFTGVGLILSIPGLIFSILGLKSQNRHPQAVVGLVLSIIEIIVALLIILYILFLIAFIGAI